ncbi:Ft-interacting protein [Thalictrum thalictroides]|uniref:Ft-interacting protein n=1 Tax=Thalictrum thalictroides TaxID=46969 RepID=A0A7J6XB26_THATH|nr:Ft-interacting protein [Thalictrum thalictroides]
MKLVVEVVDAHDLMPKDGEGSSSPFVEVDFVNQRIRSQTIQKNLNPVWNEKLLLNLDDPNSLHHNDIEVCVYNDRKTFPGRNFLGKVKIQGSNIVKKGEEALQRFQLEKKWFFSSVKGEIGLKIYTSQESEAESLPTSHQPALALTPTVSSTTTTTSTENPAASNIESIAYSNTPPTVSTAEVTANSSKDFLSVPKASPAAVNNSLKVEANTSTATGTTTSADSSGTTAAEEPEEPREIIVETVQYIHKHQAFHQQGISLERPVSVSSSTMHQINPQAHANRQEDFKLKDTSPRLGERWPNGGVRGGSGGWMSGERLASTYDLVEQMYYLYVRVVKAKELPTSSITGSCDPYIEVKLGNYKGTTRHFEKKTNPEWNQVFAFSKDRVQSSMVEVFVKDKEMVGRDDYLGRVIFDLNEVPTRVPPDSPLAPQWYRLEERRGEGKVRGEIMLAVWMGTQADEAFPEAWHSDAASVHGEGVFNIRSKVYVSPKLWYLRVNVIEAQDVQPNDRSRLPDVFVKCQVGNQLLKTKIFPRAINPLWNEDLLFVAAEPFEEHLVLTVEDRVHQSKEEMVGKISLPLNIFEKRLDHRPVHSKWFNLEKFGFGVLEGDKRKELKFSSRIHLRVCLEGAYHVLDESTMYISDQRPTARQLWKQPIGILEVGILSANGLLPMKMKDGRGTTDAYCVAKYGQKWVRTRTIIDSASPKWNEQYTWEVYDPCTVITLGVFDNCHLGGSDKPAGGGHGKDSRIGKVRIRLSTLETYRIYTHSYPLLVLHPSGVKKMGELQLAVRFTCLSLANMMYLYSQPLLPKMHYIHPFTVNQLDSLRHQAMNIVALRLARAEPPLRKEIVEYMLDVDSHMWSMRRSKANFFRIMSLMSGMITVNRWFDDVCHWKNPITTVLVHVLFLILICYPELILPTIFLYMFLIGIWNYRFRPRHPPHMDTKLSWAEAIHRDELDEEFDTFPTSRQPDLVRLRYDRLRSVAGRIQTVVGDMATQGERFHSLLSWRDPRATSLFILFCLIAAIVLYVTPFRVLTLLIGLYMLRHPRFRSKLPSVPSNFFKRLTARIDGMI